MWLAFKLDVTRLTMARHTFTTHRRVGATIVGAQVALAVITVALAGAAMQTFERLSRVDVGFATAGVTIADFALQGRDAGQVRAIHERLQRGLASLPGVTAVGGTSLRPFRFGEIGDGLPVRRPEDAAVEVDRALAVNRIVMSGQYFEALGLSAPARASLLDLRSRRERTGCRRESRRCAGAVGRHRRRRAQDRNVHAVAEVEIPAGDWRGRRCALSQPASASPRALHAGHPECGRCVELRDSHGGWPGAQRRRGAGGVPSSRS